MRISDWSSDVCSSDLLRRTGHGRQIGAELVVGRKGGHAVVVELQAEHLPGIALQRRQAPVEEQRARDALVPVAAVEKAVLARRRALRRFLRLKVPQRLVAIGGASGREGGGPYG